MSGSTRRALALLGALVLGLALSAGIAYAATDPGSVKGGSISQTGWWNALNEPPPDNPLAPPPAPPAPDVPAGTLPVTVVAGKMQRISALEFAVKGEPGATVDKLELALRETSAPALAGNAAAAIIHACPVTEAFWVGGENNPWKNRPDHDCEGKAVGVREATGLWRFDLTAVASRWLAEDFTGSRSVVLVGAEADAAGAPLTFQVVFDGTQSKGIGMLATTTPPARSGGDGGGDGFDGAGTDDGLGAGGDGAAGGIGGGDSGDFPVAGEAPGVIGATDATDPAVAAPEVTGQVTSVSSPALVLPWHEGLAMPAIVGLPLVLGLTYLTMLAMGPAAQPVAVSNRRGVSKALDKLRLADDGLDPKVGP